jgi:hypothetical protein
VSAITDCVGRPYLPAQSPAYHRDTLAILTRVRAEERERLAARKERIRYLLDAYAECWPTGPRGGEVVSWEETWGDRIRIAAAYDAKARLWRSTIGGPRDHESQVNLWIDSDISPEDLGKS